VLTLDRFAALHRVPTHNHTCIFGQFLFLLTLFHLLIHNFASQMCTCGLYSRSSAPCEREREREREKMCYSVVQVTYRDKKKEWKTRMEAASMKVSHLLPLSSINFSTTKWHQQQHCVQDLKALYKMVWLLNRIPTCTSKA
jgi:hypothetical protein